MNKVIFENPKLKGWAIDADVQNDPTYPMRKRIADNQYQKPKQQIARIEILYSNERPNYSSVIGETIPPTGLSAALRRYAFKYSESRYRHWLPLLLADRINIYEGILDDFKKGKIPNFFIEKGGRALWKYDKIKLVKTMAPYVIGSVLVISFLVNMFKKKQ